MDAIARVLTLLKLRQETENRKTLVRLYLLKSAVPTLAIRTVRNNKQQLKTTTRFVSDESAAPENAESPQL